MSSENDEVRVSQSSSAKSASDSSSGDDDDGSTSHLKPAAARPLLNGIGGRFPRGFKRKPGSLQEKTGTQRQKRNYSDSENSYEPGLQEKSTRDGTEMIDFEEHGDHKWGGQSLLQYLNADETSTLVGLAHTLGCSEDDATGIDILQDQATSNPLLDLTNVPLPLSYLNFFLDRSFKLPEFQDKLYEGFGDSALVAIGMLVEEMITASLLPLAGLHALRCRALESETNDNDDGDDFPVETKGIVSAVHPVTGQKIVYDLRNLDADEMSPFDARTLPPEEAMLKILQQGTIPESGVPIVRCPTRTLLTTNGALCGDEEVVSEFCEDSILQANLRPMNEEVFRLFLEKKSTSNSTQKCSAPRRAGKAPMQNSASSVEAKNIGPFPEQSDTHQPSSDSRDSKPANGDVGDMQSFVSWKSDRKSDQDDDDDLSQNSIKKPKMYAV